MVEWVSISLSLSYDSCQRLLPTEEEATADGQAAPSFTVVADAQSFGQMLNNHCVHDPRAPRRYARSLQ
jgi:hypothetical protein